MGVPPEVSSAGYEPRLFSISIYVNMSLLFPARMHIFTPLQLTSGSAGNAPCFAPGLSMSLWLFPQALGK